MFVACCRVCKENRYSIDKATQTGGSNSLRPRATSYQGYWKYWWFSRMLLCAKLSEANDKQRNNLHFAYHQWNGGPSPNFGLPRGKTLPGAGAQTFQTFSIQKLYTNCIQKLYAARIHLVTPDQEILYFWWASTCKRQNKYLTMEALWVWLNTQIRPGRQDLNGQGPQSSSNGVGEPD